MTRTRIVGNPEEPIAVIVEVHAEEGKREIYLQAIMSAIHELEKREPKPCSGCGDR